MKKLMSVLLVLAMAFALVACGSSNTPAATTASTMARQMAMTSRTFCCRVSRLGFFGFFCFGAAAATRFPVSLATSLYPFNASRASIVAWCTGFPIAVISSMVISRPFKRPLSRSS